MIAASVLNAALALNMAYSEPCPDWASEDSPRIERTFQYLTSVTNEPVRPGPRLDVLSPYWYKGVWFEIPYGYFNPWYLDPPIDAADPMEHLARSAKISHFTGFNIATGLYDPSIQTRDLGSKEFSFWHPSRRYVERNTKFEPAPQLCEAGLPRPASNEFIVRFHILWPGLPNSESSDVAQRFRRYGTLTYTTDSVLSILYHQNLRCAEGRGCSGWVWLPEEDFAYFLSFPLFDPTVGRRQLMDRMVEDVFILSSSWKVNSGD